MRLEGVIGWRDSDHPERICYGQPAGREGSALQAAALLGDPESVGAAQQLLADGQFFPPLAPHRKLSFPAERIMLMKAVDEYAAVRKQPPSSARLPMTAGQPDCAFADEEDGVVAVKRGNEILYVSLYWRARAGVNGLARVHHLTPRVERLATVRPDVVRFTPRGTDFYRRPDQVDTEYARDFAPKGEVHQALAGERLPVAALPAGVAYKPGRDNHYAGRAEFYALRYGRYLIGMNTTEDKTFDLPVPAGAGPAPDLISGKAVTPGGPVKVGPLSTVVLDLDRGPR